MTKAAPPAPLGLSPQELQAEINRLIEHLDKVQEDQENLGPYGEMMRMIAMTAMYRAAELIDANNRRMTEQLIALGVLTAPKIQKL